MDCLACRTPLAESMRFCPVCGTVVRHTGASPAGEPVRRLLEQALGGQYEILRIIGRGGMGVVYLARERGLERLVAIKVLAPDLAQTPDVEERFRREARTAAKLTHPGILQLHAFGEVEDFPYFVMGFVRGESLAELLRQEDHLPVDTVRRIVAELADALDYAHRHGVVHRDIKPENVLIEDETGRAILADFGIAKANASTTESITITGSILGTPQYMSPEQATGQEVDGRSDIYSLGVLAYAMLAGRTPFQGLSMREIAMRQAASNPPSVRDVVPDAPEDLVAAITRCLARDPDARWPDGRTLRLSLFTERMPEAGVPDDLREVASFGTWAVLWGVFWGWLISREHDTGETVIFTLIALLVPTGFSLQAWNIKRKGFRLRDIAHVAMWPPKWWGLWWPFPLRRPDDVWRFLPGSVRATRVVLTAFFLIPPIAAYLQRRASSWPAIDAVTTRDLLYAIEYSLLAASALVVAAAAWRWWGRGFSTDDLAKLLVGPTASTAFWSRTDVAALLRPAPAVSPARPPLPATPHEYLRAISLAASELTGSARAVGSDAILAARQICIAVEELDAEIASLTRSADPAEAARLEQRLAALGGRDADDDGEELRLLVRRQLDLLGRLTARLELATSRRVRLVVLGRELWLAVARHRDAAAEDDAGQLRQRVYSLFAAIDEAVKDAGAAGVPSPIPLPGAARLSDRRETPRLSS